MIVWSPAVMKPNDRDQKDPEDPWSLATWEGAELDTLMRGARMTMAERLAWIESMTEPADDQGEGRG
jgi:hypothetical protein